MGEGAIGVRVGGAATVRAVCDFKINDLMTRNGCVAEVSYNFEIPLLFPFTVGYLILALDGPAEWRMGVI